MKRRISAFAGFWYDFVVGDDWRVPVGVIAALALTYGLSATAIPVWWVMPAAVVVVLPLSLWRVARRSVTDQTAADAGRSPGSTIPRVWRWTRWATFT
jgi:hypothetical protein